ncbi:MAG TPA: TIGR04282 family arsenosugar biosynthesis glycosyltransferase [Candidatus Xenobia bacterium]|nr:TIGR04282 family arsenosugar biosynthesis glycosyltransferase [Candidatus Xenobia bacterium]
MKQRSEAALVIFARHPSGRVKTRLIPTLGVEGARALHIACLQATAKLVTSLPAAVEEWLLLTSATQGHARRAARRLGLPRRLRVGVQGRGDLGARLRRAFGRLWAEGFGRVVVIGSDSPALPRRRLLQALRALGRADAVLGPAQDGGYYLIGLRATAARDKKLLQGVDWGTEHAFRETLSELHRAGLRVQLLPLEFDVDRPKDLRRLKRLVRRSRSPRLGPLRRLFRQVLG